MWGYDTATRRATFVCALLIFGLGWSPTAMAQGCAQASATPAEASALQSRSALLCLVNAERARHGLRKVQSNRRLRRAAQRHAMDMARNNYFEHTTRNGRTLAQRVKRTGYLRRSRAWWLGEALAWGKQGDARPASLMSSLMDSPSHRAIILDPTFSEAGIGVSSGVPIKGDSTPGVTVTLDFGRVRRR